MVRRPLPWPRSFRQEQETGDAEPGDLLAAKIKRVHRVSRLSLSVTLHHAYLCVFASVMNMSCRDRLGQINRPFRFHL
jgi:hypothetical protein